MEERLLKYINKMNIRPRQIPSFKQGNKSPSTVTWTDPNSTWFTRSGNYGILEGTYNMLKPLYDKWKSSGNQEDYQIYKKAVDSINNDQYRYYQPGYMTYVGNNNQLFTNPQVKTWQQAINNKYSYINKSIGNRFGQYHVHSGMPTSGDNPTDHWKEDSYWAGITQDRTPWGHLSNSNDPNYLEWKKKFNDIGIDYRTNPEWGDNNVLYGFLREPKNTPSLKIPEKKFNPIVPRHREKYGFDWSKLGKGLQKTLNNPNLLAFGRLAGNLINNERVFDEQIQGISPDLKSSYHTHRQVVGDEATKQAYYKRAIQGESKAAKPFTSDADRQIAYQMEAKRIGDDLRAQGDLADNQEIKRTSDESNQHQWTNIQRDTEIANVNKASINQVNALKHNLLAQKHSAQWSSIDNFLQGIEYRKRQQLAEQQAIDDQIFTLQRQQELENDPDYINAYNKYNQIIKNNIDNTTGILNQNDTVLQAKKEFEKARMNAMIKSYKRKKEYYQNKSDYAKQGTKLIYKKKDDLLYKSTKDVIEHFRKMSKLSSDALNRKQLKIEKLTSHPKGKTKKYQQGGIAPFTIYKPVALGGETTTSSETSTSSTTKSSKNSEELDLMKELFKSLQTEGLPSDVTGIYKSLNTLMSQQKAFGNELSTEDIASLYIQQMQQLNTIKFNKAQFDEVQKIVNEKDAGSEFAIDQYGRVAVQNVDTAKIEYKKWSEIKESDKFNPLTNNDILNLRALSPDQAFKSDLLQTASNATSMSEIAKFLKEQLPKIGNSENTIEGYTKQESYEIKTGLQLLKEAPMGDYKFSQYTKDQQKQAEKALQYLAGILPKNMKSLLYINSDIQKTTPETLITSLVSSTLDNNSKIEFDAVSGKASKDSEGNNKEGLEINSAVQLLSGMSTPRDFVFNIGNGNSFHALGRISSINDVNETPFGADFSYSDIYKSTLRKNLDLDHASFGDIPINKSLKDQIIIDNSTIVGVDLPYTIDSNGRIIPDFNLLNRIEKADKEIMQLGINPEQNPQKANEIYAKHKLPIKYGANNQLTGNYKRFAVIQATAIEDVFLNKDGLSSNGTLELVSDEEEINKYLRELSKNTGQKNIDLDRPGLFTGDKDIYKGSIFIPIIGDLTDAITGSKTGKLTENNYDEYREKWNTRNYQKPPSYVKQ